MRKIIQTTSFRRDLKKFVKHDSKLRESVEKTFELMLIDPFAPFLRTHKLDGKYIGLLACSCGYDCRIVFYIDTRTERDNELIFLVAVGDHDDVY